MRTNRRTGVIAVGLFLALGLAVPPAAVGQADCNATVTIDQMRAEPDRLYTKYTYKIDVNVPVQCAVVEFNILIDVELPGGKIEAHEKYRKTKLRSQSNSYSYVFETSNENKIRSYKVEQIACRACE